MSTLLEKTVEQTIQKHVWNSDPEFNGQYDYCECGWTPGGHMVNHDEYAAHVAAAIFTALLAYQDGTRPRGKHRSTKQDRSNTV